MKLWLINQTDQHTTLVAVCTSKEKAIEFVKECVDDPSCSAPIKEQCYFDEELEYGHIENSYGYHCDYYIKEVQADDYI